MTERRTDGKMREAFMSKSQIIWRLRMVLIVLVVLTTFAELDEKGVASDDANRDSHGPRFGITVTSLTPAVLRTLGLPAGTPGVLVAKVQPRSVAEEAGLRTGDVIQKVNHKAAANMAEYEKAMQRVDTMVMFLINRGGHLAYVALEGPAEPVR